MIPREHLARWLGVSEGRISQTMHSLVDAWGLVERRRRPRGDPLHAVRRGHTLRHSPRPRSASDHAGRLEHGPHDRPSGPQLRPDSSEQANLHRKARLEGWKTQ